jgi:hypothetical protein
MGGRTRSARSRSLGPVDEPVGVAHALGGDQHALGVETVQDDLEALILLADEVLGGHLEIVEEDLVGLVVHHVADGPDFMTAAQRIATSTMKTDSPPTSS